MMKKKMSSSHNVEREVRSCVPLQHHKHLLSRPVSNVLSYLGTRNPFPQSVTQHDEVWLFDNTAFPVPTRPGQPPQWKAEFVAAVFSQRLSRCDISSDTSIVQQMADKLGLVDDNDKDEYQAAKSRIAERLRPFLLPVQPGKRFSVVYGGDGQCLLTLGPGGRSGISADTQTLLGTICTPGTLVTSAAAVPKSTTGLLKAKTFFPTIGDGSGGGDWAVVSDVDDTLKVTLTAERLGLLQSTFVDEAQPVAGMPDLLWFLQRQVTAAAPFFYLSASPYNLYPFLRRFRDDYYPHGQLMLRPASWMSFSGLLSNLTMGTLDYKVAQMRKIRKWLPRTRLICVGDSTQTDPEAYGHMYRQTGPQWIQLILIRKVRGVVALGVSMEEKNSPQRFEEAFKGVPRRVWHVFEEPEECYDLIQGVVN